MSTTPARTETDKILARMERKIKKEYRQAEREVAEKLDRYLSAFERKDKVKRLALKKGLITQKEYNDWRTGQIMIGQRWDEMRNNLAHDYHNANEIAKRIVNGYTPDVYTANFNYGTYEVEHSSGLDTAFTLYNRDAVERILRDNPEMLPPISETSRIKAANKDIRWNNQKIQSVMTQSLLQGESIPKIANRLAYAVGDMNMKSAIRNARTMTTRAENYGLLNSYKRAEKLGIEGMKVWVATLDHRTRDSHVDMDGEKVEVDKTFSNGMDCPGGSGPPEEVYNCRCRMEYEMKGYEKDMSKAERNSKLGDMDYDEWKQNARDRQSERLQRKKDKAAKQKGQTTTAKTTPQPITTTASSDRFDRQNGALDASYKQTLEKRYDQGTDVAKKVYDKYVPNGGEVSISDRKGTARLHQGKVEMNFKSDAKNRTGDGSTWFHEHGHFVDYKNLWQAGKYNSDFRDAIRNDVKAYESAIKAANGLKSITETRQAIAQEFFKIGDKSAGLQDIFGGTIGKRYTSGCWGHSQKYWRDRPDYGLSSEAFANMFEASFDKDKSAMMQKYLPTAWKEFEKILKGLI